MRKPLNKAHSLFELKKALPLILIVVLALVIILIRNFEDAAKPRRGFDRTTGNLAYSNHARCRMECREIDQSEVEGIMMAGRVNYKKSDLKNARCPRYALEGLTKDKQRVRIVFAQCSGSTTVVTVIDLNTDHKCNCPGDD